MQNLPEKILLWTLLAFPFVMLPGIYNIYTLPKVLLLGLLAIVLCISGFFCFQKKPIELDKNLFILFSFLSFFLLLIGVSSVFSPDIWRAIVGSGERVMGLSWYMFFVIIFSSLLLTEKKTTDTIIRYIPIIGGILSLIGIIQVLGDFGNIDGRPLGTIGQYNIYGTFLLFPLFLSAEKALSSRQKIFYALVFLLVLVGIFLTQSRAAILGLFVGGLFLIIFSFLNQSFGTCFRIPGINALFSIKKGVFITVILGILCIIGLSFLARFSLSDENLASIYSRGEIIKYGLTAIGENPLTKNLIGGGPESQKFDLTKQYSNTILAYEKPGELPDRVHNPLLDFWLEFGILGLVCFIIIFYVIPTVFWVRIAKRNLLDTAVFATILGIHVATFFGFYGPTIFILLAIGITYLLKRQEKTISFPVPRFMVFSILGIVLLSSLTLVSFMIKELSDEQNLIENTNLKLPVTIQELQTYSREEFQAQRALSWISSAQPIDTDSYDYLEKSWNTSPYQLSRHILFLLASSRRESGQKLLEKSNAILDIFPKNGAVLLLKGDILKKLGNDRESRKTYQILIDDMPDFVFGRAPKTDYEKRKREKILQFLPDLENRYLQLKAR